jgi:hypothetical protein
VAVVSDGQRAVDGRAVALFEVTACTTGWIRCFHSLPFGHAVGIVLIVMLGVSPCKSVLSVAFFRDPSLGVARSARPTWPIAIPASVPRWTRWPAN